MITIEIIEAKESGIIGSVKNTIILYEKYSIPGDPLIPYTVRTGSKKKVAVIYS
jgi:hypothetical protein